MEKDYSELIEYLDGKFTNIDGQLSDLKEGKADKSDVANLAQRMFSVEEKIENLQENMADKEDVNKLLNAIDASAKREATDIEEMASLSHKVDRHDKWLHQAAQKLDIKLEY